MRHPAASTPGRERQAAEVQTPTPRLPQSPTSWFYRQRSMSVQGPSAASNGKKREHPCQFSEAPRLSPQSMWRCLHVGPTHGAGGGDLSVKMPPI